ncbi:MAG: cytochrome c oxidase accessory protein FixG [Rhodocyclaceae bacterium]|nr:cytochrome c oxidase accessory protein FixG [Rhodocyclaceae bacterium]
MSKAAKPATEQTEATVSLYEKRRTIYARATQGLFANWRIALVVLTQAIFYGGLWLDWNGRQALLLHLVERKFYIFGLILWPQDVFYLAVLLIISAYGLFLVTAVGGRLFCGYACPQTVYTEVFMWIENWVEGERNARIKLDNGPMTVRKARIKLTKHFLWLLVALWTGFTLVGYFTPVTELIEEAKTFAFGPWETFWIFFYGGFTYMMAGFMREQVCKYMCPYARFQSVMFDPDTLLVTYDPERGEPRGTRRKGTDPKAQGLGECVDCGICVQVCPTGIDIRNGLQYECIGCAACIDACDQVMDKVGYPRGLVRYSTENAGSLHLSRRDIFARVVRPRILLYTAILFLIVGAAGWSLGHRIPLKVDVIRDRATLAREADDGSIENIYMLRLMNTDEKPHLYQISVAGLDSIGIAGPREIEVASASVKEMPMVVRVQPEAGKPGSNPMRFTIVAAEDGSIRVEEKAAFILPQ